jgi:hypothetical protein
MENKKNKIMLVVLGLTVITGTACAGLTGHWILNDGSGQIAADSSGNGYDGQLGSTAGADIDDPTWETDAARFDGTYFNKQHVNLDVHVSTFGALTQGTIAAWFKKDTMAESDPAPVHVNNNQVIFSISDSTAASCEFILFAEQGALKVMSRGGTGNISMVSGPNLAGEDVGVTDGNWHHAALTVDASGNAVLYLDGSPVANAAAANFLNNVSSGSYTADTMAIGVNDDSGTGKQWGFDGLLKDVRVYDNPLSSQEIAILAIPEPATLSLIGLGGVLLLRKKNSK